MTIALSFIEQIIETIQVEMDWRRSRVSNQVMLTKCFLAPQKKKKKTVHTYLILEVLALVKRGPFF